MLPWSAIASLLETNASPQQAVEALTLCGPSIERTHRVGDDTVLDIEITANRIDTASVVGIAQEAYAILPRFGYTATWKKDVWATKKFALGTIPLTIETQPSLAPRITAVVLEIDHLRENSHVRDFIEKCGIRSIHPVVDMSNYLMLWMGQPVHMFDYDKIEGHTMKVRFSKRGERITLVDGKTYTLPGNDIVIEDASKLIDLCGIMGGAGTEISENTKKVVFFLPSYTGSYIRRTSMETGARSVASSYYERAVDMQRIDATLSLGVEMLTAHGATVASRLITLYEKQKNPQPIRISLTELSQRIGVKMSIKDTVSILTSLGCKVRGSHNLAVTPPFWRAIDMTIPEDVLEEVARIYGYHRIPETVQQCAAIEDLAISSYRHAKRVEGEIKQYMRSSGFYELYTSSMYSNTDREKFSLGTHLILANPLTVDQQYMRVSLLPSLYNSLGSAHRIFEIARIYLPQKHDLPAEIQTLCLMGDIPYPEMKGYIDGLSAIMRVNFSYATRNDKPYAQSYASIEIAGETIGEVGILSRKLCHEAGREITYAHISLSALIPHYVRNIAHPKGGARVIEDITYMAGKDYSFITEKMKQQFPSIERITLKDTYKKNVTIRIYSYESHLASYVTWMRSMGITVVGSNMS